MDITFTFSTLIHALGIRLNSTVSCHCAVEHTAEF